MPSSKAAELKIHRAGIGVRAIGRAIRRLGNNDGGA